jgi:hypothetical protein
MQHGIYSLATEFDGEECQEYARHLSLRKHSRENLLPPNLDASSLTAWAGLDVMVRSSTRSAAVVTKDLTRIERSRHMIWSVIIPFCGY